MSKAAFSSPFVVARNSTASQRLQWRTTHVCPQHRGLDSGVSVTCTAEENHEFEVGSEQQYIPPNSRSFTREELDKIYEIDIRSQIQRCYEISHASKKDNRACLRCSGKGVISCRVCFGRGFSTLSSDGQCPRCAPVRSMPTILGSELCPMCRGVGVNPEWRVSRA